MSEVANVLLAFSILEDSAARIAEVNEWLGANEQPPFATVWENETCSGGGKRMDAPLYAGAFNYFPMREFLAFLRSLRWAEPDTVQLLVRGPGESRWLLIDA